MYLDWNTILRYVLEKLGKEDANFLIVLIYLEIWVYKKYQIS
jgi:hypothetical protein